MFTLLTGILLTILPQFVDQPNTKYLFFLHNRFLEEHSLVESHPVYGRVEYEEIFTKYRKEGFEVISEHRKESVNASEYARKVVLQIDSLLSRGVQAKNITVVGTSKGGYIAQYVSTYLTNPDINYVFIACFTDNDIHNIPGIDFSGNVLTIYEKSDPAGISARARFLGSTSHISHFKEVALETALNHGFVFKALDDWISPSIEWAKGNYHFDDSDTLHESTSLRVVRLTDNTYLHTSYLAQYNNVACNGLIYTKNGEAVVFDTPTTNDSSSELIEWIRTDLESEIKAVIVNHFHIDCLGGLEMFHKLGILSYANHKSIELAKSERSHTGVVPDHGFDSIFVMSVGESRIINRFFGPGHSPDNMVSFIPEERILFGGCLIKSIGAGVGSLTDADVTQWSKTVEKVRSNFNSNIEVVIPGHGSPGDTSLLNYTIKLFEER